MAATPGLDADVPAGAAFAVVLGRLAADIDARWEQATDAADPEGLHELRGVLRRTRAVLWAGRRALPRELVDEAVPRFRALTAATGAARDLDVLVTGWDAEIGAAGVAGEPALDLLLARLSGQRDDERAAMAEVLRGEGATAWRARWHELLDGAASHPHPGRHARRRFGRVAGARLDAANRRLLRAGRAVGEGATDAELHEVRKAARRLRHLLEAFAELFPAKPHRQVVRELKALQDVLGRHQDLAVHLALVEGAVGELTAQGTAPASEAVEPLTAFLTAARDDARASFANAFDAYDRPRARRDLDRLLAPIA